MTDAYKCDRCGKLSPGLRNIRHLPHWPKFIGLVSIDLCEECANDFDADARVMIDKYDHTHGKRHTWA